MTTTAAVTHGRGSEGKLYKFWTELRRTPLRTSCLLNSGGSGHGALAATVISRSTAMNSGSKLDHTTTPAATGAARTLVSVQPVHNSNPAVSFTPSCGTSLEEKHDGCVLGHLTHPISGGPIRVVGVWQEKIVFKLVFSDCLRYWIILVRKKNYTGLKM